MAFAEVDGEWLLVSRITWGVVVGLLEDGGEAEDEGLRAESGLRPLVCVDEVVVWEVEVHHLGVYGFSFTSLRIIFGAPFWTQDAPVS